MSALDSQVGGSHYKDRKIQPEQEPVAWMNESGSCFLSDGNKYNGLWVPLYTSPPNQKPLSDEWIKNNIHFAHQDVSFTDLVRAVEKAHGIGVK